MKGGKLMGRNSNTVSMQRQLKRQGYEFVRQNGSHKIYMQPETGKKIVINLKLNKMVMRRLQKEM